jgi:hypothetical protein
MKRMGKLNVGQKKTYRIQKEAMAEFGYDLKFAMKGGYRLDDQYLVWFPNLMRTESDKFPTLFGNVLKDNGKTVVEIVSDDKRLEKILRDTSTIRIAFARFKGHDFEFKGVFKYHSVDRKRRQIVYTRIAEKIDTDKWLKR